MPIYTPAELAAHVAGQRAGISEAAFVTKTEHQRLREMWGASAFATGYARWQGQCLVDIAEIDEQQYFDFHLVVGDLRLPFQMTEVLDEDRRRGDEYRNLTPAQVEELYRNRPMRNGDYAARRTATELQNKLGRLGPSPDLHMLCYLNLNAAGVQWATMHNGAEPQSRQFASVWVLTNQMIGCIWSGNHWAGLNRWRLFE